MNVSNVIMKQRKIENFIFLISANIKENVARMFVKNKFFKTQNAAERFVRS